jgi:BMFP domain-containing protein YqiC
VESIKELKAENDMLKQRLAELEKKLNVKEAGTAPVKITR